MTNANHRPGGRSTHHGYSTPWWWPFSDFEFSPLRPFDLAAKLIYAITCVFFPAVALFKGLDGAKCELPFNPQNPSRYTLKAGCFARGLQLTVPDSLLDAPPPPAPTIRTPIDNYRRRQQQQQQRDNLFGDNLNEKP